MCEGIRRTESDAVRERDDYRSCEGRIAIAMIGDDSLRAEKVASAKAVQSILERCPHRHVSASHSIKVQVATCRSVLPSSRVTVSRFCV